MKMALDSFGSRMARGETSPPPGGPGENDEAHYLDEQREAYNEDPHEILRPVVPRYPLPGVSCRYGAGRPQRFPDRRGRRHGGRAPVGTLVNAHQPWPARQFATR